MKGLLKKDGYMLWKYGKITLLSCLIFLVAGSLNTKNLFFMLYLVIIGPALCKSLSSYDERSGWDRYCDALPLTRKLVVSEKYLFTLIVVAGIAILGMASRALTAGLHGGQLLPEATALLSAGILIPTITFPLDFRFGMETGRLINLFIIGMICAVMAARSLDRGETVGALLPWGNGAAMLVVMGVLVLYGLSWLLSVRIYERREF